MRVIGVSSSKSTRSCGCRQVAERATEFLEGRLPAAARARWVRHVDTCTPCATYAQQIALVRAALHRLPGVDMPPSARNQLLERLAERSSSG